MQVSVRLGAFLIPEYLDFHSGCSAPSSRIAEIYSGIYSYSGIYQTNASLVSWFVNTETRARHLIDGSEKRICRLSFKVVVVACY